MPMGNFKLDHKVRYFDSDFSNVQYGFKKIDLKLLEYQVTWLRIQSLSEKMFAEYYFC